MLVIRISPIFFYRLLWFFLMVAICLFVIFDPLIFLILSFAAMVVKTICYYLFEKDMYADNNDRSDSDSKVG